MRRTVRRLMLTTIATLVVAGLIAAPALAATATTQPATAIGTTSATLNGTVNTGGAAAIWQFQYGTSTSYNKATPFQSIAAGVTTPQSVSWKLINLSPLTLYHFRLAVTTGNGTSYYPVQIVYGIDRAFTTKSTGSLKLLADVLRLKNGFVFVPLRCVSKLSCVGKFSITTRARLAHTHKFAQIDCTAGKFFRIKPHQKAVEKAGISKACVALLKHARHHRITAKFTSRPMTGQSGVIKLIKLTL